MIKIKPLNKDLIHRANSNSMIVKRGDTVEADYQEYARRIMSWRVSDHKKKKLLDILHQKFCKYLEYQANHVSVMVAGPSKYNAKRLDKSDQVLKTGADIHNWFSGLEDQVKRFLTCEERDRRDLERTTHLVKASLGSLGLLTGYLVELAYRDPALFIKYYEQLQPKFKWKSMSRVTKLYKKALAGEIPLRRREVLFEDENFIAYSLGNRVFLSFVLEPQQQLKIAMKARGIYWNAYEGAYGGQLEKYDPEWVASISTQYSRYI